jgi:hypothetical protein
MLSGVELALSKTPALLAMFVPKITISDPGGFVVE